jgi:hypothetical protein
MDFIKQIIAYVQGNWVSIVATLWLIEQAMRAISILTPWKWDDNLVKVLANVLTRFFPKKNP